MTRFLIVSKGGVFDTLLCQSSYPQPDATYEGIYTYPADAITEQCSAVRIEIFSAEKPNEPQIENVKPKYVKQLVSDFKPYFDMKGKVN